MEVPPIMLIPWICFVKSNEQFFVEAFTRKFVINVPSFFFAPPFYRVIRRNWITLEPTRYITIKDYLTGEFKNVYGPKFKLNH